MPFQKGHKLSKGKPKGAITEKTKQWEAIAENMTTTHAERFNRILQKTDDKTFADLYIKILEFFKPKYSRAEVESKAEQIIKINVDPFKQIRQNSNISDPDTETA